MSEWVEYQLNEILEIKYGKDHKTVADGNIPIYGSGGLMRYGDRYLYNKESILIPRKGTLNNIIYKNEPFWTVDTMFYTILDSEIVVPKYLYYNLKMINFNSMNVGSAVPSLTVQVLSEIKVDLPPLQEQKAIAAVLSSLDDKIDLLHRQNQTLEAMAETLFRQWFVEEAGEDWEERTLGDVLIIKGGTTPSTEVREYWDGGIHWSTPKDLTSNHGPYIFKTERKISELGLRQIGSGLLPKGTLLLSSRAPIGYLAITHVPMAINQGYIAILRNEQLTSEFMYFWCRLNMSLIENSGNGSVFQEISKSTFKQLKINIPPIDKLDIFQSYVAVYFDKIKSNCLQIQSLTALRDTLLPKLMTGEVRVKIS